MTTERQANRIAQALAQCGSYTLLDCTRNLNPNQRDTIFWNLGSQRPETLGATVSHLTGDGSPSMSRQRAIILLCESALSRKANLDKIEQRRIDQELQQQNRAAVARALAAAGPMTRPQAGNEVEVWLAGNTAENLRLCLSTKPIAHRDHLLKTLTYGIQQLSDGIDPEAPANLAMDWIFEGLNTITAVNQMAAFYAIVEALIFELNRPVPTPKNETTHKIYSTIAGT